MSQVSLFDTPSSKTPTPSLVDPKIEESWRNALRSEFQKPYFGALKNFVSKEVKSGKKIYPAPKEIFRAFDLCPLDQVKVVILGQDPYHGSHQAHGLCFSVNREVPIPPSLQNIYKEIHDDLGLPIPSHGNLEAWARQGVLLLNAVLTVRAGQPTSHSGKGWEYFTDAVMKKISDEREGIVFLLWGNFAKSKRSLIDERKHFILTAAHPSPLSAYSGFMGCKHFSQTNDILKKQGKEPINWSI
ncbi:uracil-DNA glycosylase [Candidatus Gracilibacteria bacterium]|nr:uracil-DNA glycosylase [Candidatus Gracilibacteria bacterium]